MSSEVETEAGSEMYRGHFQGSVTESCGSNLTVSICSSFDDKLLPVITNNLLEQIVARDNMTAAYDRVCANKGAPGIDKRSVYDLQGYLQRHWARIKGGVTFRHLQAFSGFTSRNSEN